MERQRKHINSKRGLIISVQYTFFNSYKITITLWYPSEDSYGVFVSHDPINYRDLQIRHGRVGRSVPMVTGRVGSVTTSAVKSLDASAKSLDSSAKYFGRVGEIFGRVGRAYLRNGESRAFQIATPRHIAFVTSAGSLRRNVFS